MNRPLRFGFLLVIVFATSALADPLKLVSTSPQFWARNVATNQKTITLTFDQRLRSTLTDWIGLDVLSPPSDLQTKYSTDHMSCSIDVHLEPGHVYVCGLNERGLSGVGFQNEKGFALPPTYLVFQTAGTPTVENTPPHVAKTIPANGATALDPTKVRSVAVIFDVPMNIKKHGVHLFEDNQPVDISHVPFQYSADGKTFTLNYDFKPSKTYTVELNSLHDIGFARTTRVPLWPVQFTFSTGSPQ
jgi:hypothetical protein